MSIWVSDQRLLFRRARAAFDGPDPVYALMGNQRIPLSEDQVAELNRQVIELAGQPASLIRSTVSDMLAADKRGTKPPLDIAGFMRALTPYDGSEIETATNAPDSCDQCGRDLHGVGYYFDACTIENQMWSWMCPPCFFGLGCGVGEGYGQLYLRSEGEIFLILGDS